MRISVSRVLAAALVLGISSVSFAQTKAEKSKAPEKPAAPSMASVMQPSPELGAIQWMTGTWKCSGKATASPMGPEHPTEAEVKADTTLGGKWMVAHYREKKTAQNPNPIAGDEYWGYDPAGKMWTRVVLDNTGSFGTCTSKGWESGKLVWACDGMAMGQKMKTHETFVQKSPSELGYSGEMAGADGKFAPFGDLNCKK